MSKRPNRPRRPPSARGRSGSGRRNPDARPRASHRPRRRFGQHFLADTWANKIVDAIHVEPGDVFLEIGPGTGAFTRPLARTGAQVMAVEVDRDLAAALAADAPPNVTIVAADILSADVIPFLSGLESQRPPGDTPGGRSARRVRIVGNLPYNLSTPILFKLIEWSRQHAMFWDATIMLQREVADRLVAKVGTKAYGVLSVMAQMHLRMSKLLDLPPGAFSPPPKVRSSVVRLEFGPPAVRVVDEALFASLVKAMFMQRRKTLTNALKTFDATSPAVLALAGIDGRRRPETLTLVELGRLTEMFASVRRRETR